MLEMAEGRQDCWRLQVFGGWVQAVADVEGSWG
jgi:hypothetical protein